MKLSIRITEEDVGITFASCSMKSGTVCTISKGSIETIAKILNKTHIPQGPSGAFQ